MLDKTVNSALLNLRAQIIRGKLDGLGHVEALLVARGVSLPAVPRKRPADTFKRLSLRLLIMEGLRCGPVRSAMLIEQVMAKQPDVSRIDATHRVHNVLWKMKVAGLVVRDGRLWKLSSKSVTVENRPLLSLA